MIASSSYHIISKFSYVLYHISGSRIAGPHWRNTGVAVVNKNFIRLTPDRQSKKGAIWSRRSIGEENDKR